jgi:hypothetical protein
MTIMKRSLSLLGVLMMTMVTMSGAAQASVAHDEADWGMRYDWTNLDVDSQTVLGSSFTQIVDDLEANMAAEGINLDIDEAAAGTTEFYVEIDALTVTPTTVLDANGNSHVVTSARQTTFTVRSVILLSMNVETDWQDSAANAEWDMAIEADAHKALLMDFVFIEHMDINGDVVKVDMTGGASIEVALSATFDGAIEGGVSVLNIPVSTIDATLFLKVENVDATWLLGEPSSLYDTIGQLDTSVPGLLWDCRSGETSAVVQESNSGGVIYNGGLDASDWYRHTDDCGTIDVDFDYHYGYDITTTLWPSVDLGFPTENVNVQLTDSIMGSVSYTETQLEWFQAFERLPGTQQHDVDGDGSVETLWMMQGEHAGFLTLFGLSEAMLFMSTSSLAEIDDSVMVGLEDTLDSITDDYDENTGVMNDIIDAFDLSTLGDQLDDALDAFETGTIDAIETHIDQTWTGGIDYQVLWDDDAKAFVGLQVIGEVSGTDDLLTGLETSTYGAPFLPNIEYLTDGDASTAQDSAATMTTPQDLLNSVTLPQSGSGTSGAGMLPAAGMTATLMVALLGAVVIARRQQEIES